MLFPAVSVWSLCRLVLRKTDGQTPDRCIMLTTTNAASVTNDFMCYRRTWQPQPVKFASTLTALQMRSWMCTCECIDYFLYILSFSKPSTLATLKNVTIEHSITPISKFLWIKLHLSAAWHSCWLCLDISVVMITEQYISALFGRPFSSGKHVLALI